MIKGILIIKVKSFSLRLYKTLSSDFKIEKNIYKKLSMPFAHKKSLLQKQLNNKIA